jgi:DNA polymerase III alpha subunit
LPNAAISTLTLGKNFLPQFPTPDGMTLDDYLISCSLIRVCRSAWRCFTPMKAERAAQRLPEYQARLDFELHTIIQMGFPGYFLIVQDFHQLGKRTTVALSAPGAARAQARCGLCAQHHRPRPARICAAV